jgi:proline iminopeptidase
MRAGSQAGLLRVRDTFLWHRLVPGQRPDVSPLVVLHGGLGLDHTTLSPRLDGLTAATSAVVYVDLRGNGRSHQVADWHGVDHATFVADIEAVRAVLQARGLPAERLLLFGHSYGGFLAQEYALTFPERLAGLLLCATAPAMRHAEESVSRARARATPAVRAAFDTLLTGPVLDDDALARGTRAVFPLYFHAPTPSMCAALLENVVFRAAAFNRSFGELLPTFDVRERLGQLASGATPVLLLGGDDDWLMPTAHTLDVLAAGLPAARRVEFAACGHMPFAEQPAAFEAVVLAWLSDQVDRAGTPTSAPSAF